MTVNRGVKADRNETSMTNNRKRQGSSEIDAMNRKTHDGDENGMTDRKKQGSNENGRKDLRKPVKIIVKSVYSGKQNMAEVFGNVALDNIRRKMRES